MHTPSWLSQVYQAGGSEIGKTRSNVSQHDIYYAGYI